MDWPKKTSQVGAPWWTCKVVMVAEMSGRLSDQMFKSVRASHTLVRVLDMREQRKEKAHLDLVPRGRYNDRVIRSQMDKRIRCPPKGESQSKLRVTKKKKTKGTVGLDERALMARRLPVGEKSRADSRALFPTIFRFAKRSVFHNTGIHRHTYTHQGVKDPAMATLGLCAASGDHLLFFDI